MLSSDIKLKTKPLPSYCGVGVCVCVCGGGNQDVITIQTSTMTRYRRQYLARCLRVGLWQWLQIHFTLTTHVGTSTCVPLITMDLSTDTK